MNAFRRGAMAFAMATGARMSAPFAVTPCGSSVPSGNSTVCTFDGTAALNSIQLMRAMSRSTGAPCCCAAASAATRRSAVCMVRYARSLLHPERSRRVRARLQVFVEPADDVLQALDAVPRLARAREVMVLVRETHHHRFLLLVLQ